MKSLDGFHELETRTPSSLQGDCRNKCESYALFRQNKQLSVQSELVPHIPNTSTTMHSPGAIPYPGSPRAQASRAPRVRAPWTILLAYASGGCVRSSHIQIRPRRVVKRSLGMWQEIVTPTSPAMFVTSRAWKIGMKESEGKWLSCGDSS
jgi:hypothetical protein